MFVLFDKKNICYGVYDKLDYVINIIEIVKKVNPKINFLCKKYITNTNAFEIVKLKDEIDELLENKDSELKEISKIYLPRIETWYEKFNHDLDLFETFKSKDEDIPLLFEEKYQLFKNIEDLEKKDKFDCFINKFYLKDQNDTSFYELF